LFEHDLFGKPVSTFPDHALNSISIKTETAREMVRKLHGAEPKTEIIEAILHVDPRLGAVGEL
jgi:hypothetical protein